MFRHPRMASCVLLCLTVQVPVVWLPACCTQGSGASSPPGKPQSPPYPRAVMNQRAQSGPARISTEALAQVGSGGLWQGVRVQVKVGSGWLGQQRLPPGGDALG